MAFSGRCSVKTLARAAAVPAMGQVGAIGRFANFAADAAVVELRIAGQLDAVAHSPGYLREVQHQLALPRRTLQAAWGQRDAGAASLAAVDPGGRSRQLTRPNIALPGQQHRPQTGDQRHFPAACADPDRALIDGDRGLSLHIGRHTGGGAAQSHIPGGGVDDQRADVGAIDDLDLQRTDDQLHFAGATRAARQPAHDQHRLRLQLHAQLFSDGDLGPPLRAGGDSDVALDGLVGKRLVPFTAPLRLRADGRADVGKPGRLSIRALLGGQWLPMRPCAQPT
jgi:hypothetical protein